MAINLDEMISGATSVDDLLAVLTEESSASKKASAQLTKLAGAAEGVASSGSWLDKLKSVITPTSAAGKLMTDELYKQYYIDATSNGEEPVSREEFLKALEKSKASQKG